MGQKKNVHAGHRQRKKEIYVRQGLDAFAPHEALELLLYYAIPRRDTNVTAHALMERFGSLDGVFKAPVSELARVSGVGENTAILLRLVPEIFRRSQVELDKPGMVIDSYEKAGEVLRKYFWGERNELVVMMCLDAKCRMVGCHKLSTGSSSSLNFDIRDLMMTALADKSSKVYLAHNHPSGVALPSEEDIMTTRNIYRALDEMNVELMDHLVMAEDDYTSMEASGIIDRVVWKR